MVVEGVELLVQVRERLLQITNRLTNIQAGRAPIGAHEANFMTLREFTEKHLNDKNTNGQEADYPSPRASA